MNRQDKRRAEREDNKITQILPYRKMPYSDGKRIMTKKQEREILEHITQEVYPFNILRGLLSGVPYKW